MPNLIRINGAEYPQPSRGLSMKIDSNIDTVVNAYGETVGQRVGRDRQTINNLQWAYLKADVWAKILQEFEKKSITISYPDMVTAQWKTIRVMPGSREATPCHLDRATGLPLDYVNCHIELIDCGAE